MKKQSIKLLSTVILSSGLLVGGTALAQAQKPYYRLNHSANGSYRIDSQHTLVTATIGHAGVGLYTVAFDGVKGDYTFNAKHPEQDKVNITIPISSLVTFDTQRTHDLKTKAFFDAKKYPNIHFISTRYVEKTPSSGLLYGRLTLRGVTRSVVFRVHQVGAGNVPWLPKPWGGYLSGFVARTRINRLNYGVSAYPTGLSHEVYIYVEVEGVKQ